jgi:translation initiation factor 2B subunit (eIF-2B alpha/beta/delta family)
MSKITTIAISVEKKKILDKLKNEMKAKNYDELIDRLSNIEKELKKERKKRKSLELLIKWENNPVDIEKAKERIEEIKESRKKILR